MSLPPWLADPALIPVWDRLRAPLERGVRATRLSGLPRASRHALAAVLGRPVLGEVTLALEQLSTSLQARAGMDLRTVVEQATGRPLRDRDAERRAREEPLAVLRNVDPAWAAAVRASGVLTRSPDALAVARTAVRVRAQLPGPARLRTELAAAAAGDAHALDEGRPLAAVVLRGLTGGPLPPTAAERRAVWERHGVLSDAVSTTVLTLGLRPAADGPREDRLRAAATAGDPVHLTLWDLARTALAGEPGAPVLVVENPSVVEALAVRYGGAYPVVCTSGWPATVAVDLLDVLAAPLAYHGDLDWRGVEIAAWLVHRCGVRPWRMGAADYLAAPRGAPLAGRAGATPWDPSLRSAMLERGSAVYQEQVLDQVVQAWPAARAGWSS